MKAKSLNYWPTREFPVHTLLMEGYNANSTDGNLKISTEIKYPGGSDGKVPTIQETWVRSLGQEDPLEKEMATHFSILAWKIPWTKEPGRLQSMGSQRVGHDWVTSLTYSLTKQFCLKEHTSTVDFLRLKGSAITSKNCSRYLQYGHPDHELHTRTFTAAPGVLVNY